MVLLLIDIRLLMLSGGPGAPGCEGQRAAESRGRGEAAVVLLEEKGKKKGPRVEAEEGRSSIKVLAPRSLSL